MNKIIKSQEKTTKYTKTIMLQLLQMLLSFFLSHQQTKNFIQV